MIVLMRSYQWKRVVGILLFIALTVSAGNLYLEWGWFGRFDKAVCAAIGAVGVILLQYIVPTESSPQNIDEKD